MGTGYLSRLIIKTSSLLALIIIFSTGNCTYAADKPIFLGANLTTPQSFSFPIIIPITHNPNKAIYNCFVLEPGISGQKIHFMHMMTAGHAGPAAWDLTASSLYMTRKAHGFDSDKLYMGGEVGGFLFYSMASLGIYKRVTAHGSGPDIFISASIGLWFLPFGG